MTAPAPLDLGAWSGVELIRPLAGGARNPTYLARRGSQEFVARVSGRQAESLVWELDLLDTLDAAGVAVPRSVATDDGRRHDRGVLLQRFISGGPPRDRRDWERVLSTLGVVHETTTGWPQRPGFASARDLLVRTSGGDVQLDAMPDDAVALIRASWRAIISGAPGQDVGGHEVGGQDVAGHEVAIHGDLGGDNVVMTDRQVALIDWDEARVDVPAFDFAHLPTDVPVPVSGDRTALLTAGVAWEAATCWTAEPAYAARRLAELRARSSASPESPGG